MKINYQLIRKIHLYACLSTVAVLIMFIVTSYLMIHHSWFNREPTKTTATVGLNTFPATDQGWREFLNEQNISGRLVQENTDRDGHPFRVYERAAGHTRLTLQQEKKQVEIIRTEKTTTGAMIGIHRQRGYGGPLQYSLYAVLLDILGLSLIIFTVTGVIMWFKLLKNNRTAWIIFILGFLYFSITMGFLMYW